MYTVQNFQAHYAYNTTFREDIFLIQLWIWYVYALDTLDTIIEITLSLKVSIPSPLCHVSPHKLPLHCPINLAVFIGSRIWWTITNWNPWSHPDLLNLHLNTKNIYDKFRSMIMVMNRVIEWESGSNYLISVVKFVIHETCDDTGFSHRLIT